MSITLTRMFTYFTLLAYLVVGAVAVRVLAPEMTTVNVSLSYSKYFSKTQFKAPENEEVKVPEMAFAEIKFPVEKKVIVKKAAPAPKAVVVAKSAPVKPAELQIVKVAKNELPFKGPVELAAVVMNVELEANLVALHKDFKYEAALVAEVKEDAVSTKLAADAEPEFFEYPEVKEEKKAEAPAKAEIAEIKSEEISTDVEVVHNVENEKAVDNSAEEIAVDDLIAFDYSKVEQDLKEQTIPTVSKVTTQNVIQGTSAPVAAPVVPLPAPTPAPAQKMTTHKEAKALVDNSPKTVKTDVADKAAKTYENRVSIQISGTNLKETREEVGFEVRFQDDQSEALSDYNNGSVNLDQVLARPKMTRSITVLKRGFAPTNTDLILEEGVSEVTVPAIEEDTFNELLATYESRGPIGAVLVELDEKVDGANLDVPYSQVLKLDEDMKVTESEDFAYQMFVGVKAGNALLSYKSNNGEVTSKIVHVHEHELTFEANFFEAVENETVALVEDELLSREKTPLIISSEAVRQFASDKIAKKINDHTYKTDFRRTLLAGRKYLELGHQEEPVFVGFKDSATLEVPSENFMRYILSRFENNKLGNRCMVQVNLKKKAVRVDVGTESTGEALMAATQVLDADGKFYDSVGAKTRKVIVVGENQGAPGMSQDGKINFKITYQDGSVQFLGSYCSPNTYLVEQL